MCGLIDASHASPLGERDDLSESEKIREPLLFHIEVMMHVLAYILISPSSLIMHIKYGGACKLKMDCGFVCKKERERQRVIASGVVYGEQSKTASTPVCSYQT